jgi:phage-related tail fiber protein
MTFQNGTLWPSGRNQAGFMKINGSTGAVVWSRWTAPTDPSNYSTYGMNVIVGSDGYIYCLAYDSYQKLAITKVDTSGNVQWQRSFYGPNGGAGSLVGYGVNVSITGSTMYISCAYSIPNNAPLLIKVPTDGSKTGSYYASFNGNTYVYTSYSSWNDLSGYFDLSTTATWNLQNPGNPVAYTTGNTTGANSATITQLVTL